MQTSRGLTEEASQRGVGRVAGVPLGVVAGRGAPASGGADGGRRRQQLGAVAVAQLGRREGRLLTCTAAAEKNAAIRASSTDTRDRKVGFAPHALSAKKTLKQCRNRR